MNVARTLPEAREAVSRARARGARTALVPTMGSLHEGHLRLVDRARDLSDFVVVSIFVNPLQFAQGEDLESYPRDVEGDLELCRTRGVELVFLPDSAAMYPHGEPDIRVVPGALGEGLCGAFRPGHFEGVLTVVAKLFHILEPSVAVFGRKDYQQAVLVRRMVRDLDFPVEIELAPIVREPDGLAMSSRNRYLTGDERRRAAALHGGLQRGLEEYRQGERDAEAIRARVRRGIESAGDVRVQYVELVDPDTLRPLDRAPPGGILAVAAFVGRTRLIDNLVLS